MRFYRILPFIAVLLIGILMMNRAGVVSSASQPQLETDAVVVPEGISITGPLDVAQGDSVTYTINYSAVPASGGVEYKISGMAFSGLEIVSMSQPGNVESDSIIWPFDTIGASGSITIEVKHNDCGAITHSALVSDIYGDPNTTQASASITTLVECPPPDPPEPAQCEGITLRSNGNGNWDSASSWQEGRVPNSNDVVWIQQGHTITAPYRWWTMNIKALCNEGTLKSRPNRSLWMRVTDFVINLQTGQIIGQNGSSGGANYWGRWGSSIGIYAPSGNGVEITNHGLIHSGHGGDGRYGASGGHIWLLGRNVFNSQTGKICSGNGGNTLGTGANPWWSWARGGNVFMWGHFRGPGFLINNGEICSGSGGNGNPVATVPQRGGNGGCIWLMSRPLLDLSGGSVIGGVGGLGTGGGPDGRNGGRGCVRIDPEGVISVRNGARIEGGDVSIYGGDNWVLDLSDSSGSLISATEGITLAVGTNGIVDLRGNTGAILQTEQDVTIFSDDIRFDGQLTDVINAATVDTQPARVLRFVSLAAPQLVAGEAGTALPVEITVQNNGPETDTYDLTIADSENWTLSGLPNSVTVEGLSSQTLELEVTPPLQTGNNTTDMITITLTSQSDSTVVDVQQIEVVVEDPNVLYLPVINR
ncbi:MAG: hypothetical protein ACPGWR_19945 [Ardenticatenaceae bacterium]